MYDRRQIATVVARVEDNGLIAGVEDVVFCFAEALGRVGRRMLTILSIA